MSFLNFILRRTSWIIVGRNRQCPLEQQQSTNINMLNQQCSSQTQAFQLQVFLHKQPPDKGVEPSTLITIPKVQSSQMLYQAPFAGVCSSITSLRKLTTQTVGRREETEPLETMNPTSFSIRMLTLIQSALTTHRWTCMPIVPHMIHITDLGDRQLVLKLY